MGEIHDVKEVTIGPISVRIKEDGTYLKINKEINDALLTAILRKEGLPTLEPKVSATLRKHIGEWIKILDSPVHRDAFVETHESPDLLKLRLTYHPPLGNGENLTVEDIVSYLIEKENVVPEFIKPENIRVAISRPGNAVVVAEGIPPKKGEDAKVVVVPVDKRAKKDEDEGEDTKRIDWHEFTAVVTVREGEPVIEKIPPTEGEPGTGVKGEIIPPIPGKDLDLKTVQGKGLQLEDDLYLVAMKTGILKQENQKFHIEEVFIVDGDLDFEVGNIKEVKHVVVHGNVLPGFQIRVEGNVVIGGSVENAIIEAGGDVHISGIVTCEKGGYIKAGGFVYAIEFIFAKVEAGGNVYADSGFRHSDIFAGGYIIASNPKSRTVGGDLKARKSLYLGNCGNIHGTKTNLTAGYSDDLRETVEGLEEEIEEIKDKLNSLRLVLQRFKRGNARKKTESALLKLERDLKEKEKTREEITAMLKAAIYNEIYITGTVYPGTHLLLASFYNYNVREEMSHVVFKLDEEGELGPVQWRDPKFNIRVPQVRVPR